MGICISVCFEGEEESPIEERADPKLLASLILDFAFADDETVGRLKVDDKLLDPIRIVDDTNYGGDATDVWQEPSTLRPSLKTMMSALPRLKEDKVLRKRIPFNDPVDEVLDEYRMILEDAIKVCDLAEEKGKRVGLVAY